MSASTVLVSQAASHILCREVCGLLRRYAAGNIVWSCSTTTTTKKTICYVCNKMKFFLKMYLGNCDDVQWNDNWLLQPLMSFPPYALVCHVRWKRPHGVSSWFGWFWCEQKVLFQAIPLSFSSPMISRWYRALQPAWWCDACEKLHAEPRMRAGSAALGRTRACRTTNQIVASNLPGNPKTLGRVCVWDAYKRTVRFNMRPRRYKTPETFVFCVHLLSFGENYRLKTWTRFNKLLTVNQYLHDI